MLSRFERAMANVSIMLVKARAPSDQQHTHGGGATTGDAPRNGRPRPASASKVGRQAAAPRTLAPKILTRARSPRPKLASATVANAKTISRNSRPNAHSRIHHVQEV